MSDPQRQHPVAALTKALEVIRSNFITILIFLFVGSGDQAFLNIYLISGTIVCLLLWGIINWLRFSFQVENGELRIEHGVIIRKKLYLTSDRIQVIDISAGIIQRLFGLVSVEVKTAGSTSKEAKISALTREKAQELKLLLRKDRAEGIEQESAMHDELASERLVYDLDNKDLLIAASTSGRLGIILSLVGVAYSQIDQIFPQERIFRFVETNWPQSASVTIVLFSIGIILLVAWLLSFISTIIKYYNFSVEVRDEELFISRGLFERTQLTIPYNRIQAVQIKEELLRQPFGFASVVIENAGYGEKEGNSTTLFPLIHRKKIYRFLDEVIPEYHTLNNVENTTNITLKGLRRYMVRMLWITLPIILLVWFLIPYGIYAWFLLIPVLLLGYQQYRDASVSNDDDTMILGYRILSKTTVIVKKYRVQAVQIHKNPFQSRLDLSNLTLFVASGNQGRSFTVRELTEPKALQYWDWLSKEDA